MQILFSLTKYARIYSERKMKLCYPRGRHVKFCCSAQSSVHDRQIFVRARVSSEMFPIISALLGSIHNLPRGWAMMILRGVTLFPYYDLGRAVENFQGK